MAGISFGASAESTWIVAGWAFRQVLQDLRRDFSLSTPLAHAIEAAEVVGFLQVQLLPDQLKSELIENLGKLSRRLLGDPDRSAPDGRFIDIETQNAYREGIEMLRNAMEAAGHGR